MTRLVGDDGNSGLIGRIEKHLTKIEKFVLYGFIVFSMDSGLHTLTSKNLLDLLKGFLIK